MAAEQKLVVIHFITFQKKGGDPGKPIIDTGEINGGGGGERTKRFALTNGIFKAIQARETFL